MFVECLDALSIAMGDALRDTALPVGGSHIFLNVLPLAAVRPEYIETVTKILARRYSDRLRRLRVSHVEFKITLAGGSGAPISLRLVSSNPTGYVLRVDTYAEAAAGDDHADAATAPPIFTSISPQSLGAILAGHGLGGGGGGGHGSGLASPWAVQGAGAGGFFGGQLASRGLLPGSSATAPALTAAGGGGSALGAAWPSGGGGFAGLGAGASLLGGSGAVTGGLGLGGSGGTKAGEWDGKPVTTPYAVVRPFERQRALAAALSDTVYVYDFLELFARAVEHDWSRYERAWAEAAAGAVDGSGGGYAEGGGGGLSAPHPRPGVVMTAVELVLRPKPGTPAAAAAAAAVAAKAAAVAASRAAPTSTAGGAPPAPGATSLLPGGGLLRSSASAVFLDQFANELQPGATPSTVGTRGAVVRQGRHPGQIVTVAPATAAAELLQQSRGADGSSSASASPMSGGTGDAKPVQPTAAAAAAGGGGGIIGSYDDYEVHEVSRAAGLNDVGMVAWRLTLHTPQYPGGRELVLIANDITHRAGSFGTLEDALFFHASAWARTRGIPRVYLAANSGARIGLSEELKRVFRVGWNDPSGADPSRGFKYLYLTRGDYARLMGVDEDSLPAAPRDAGDAAGAVSARARAAASAGASVAASSSASSGDPAPPVLAYPLWVPGAGEGSSGGEERWVVTDIIGSEPDLGVENLRGSGLIAGETSRAYAESFTLTYVTGRSVGIGAYLVRLGHRTIQKAGSAPIILTGYEALNKLMGADVYTSNLQIGGPRVMAANGVSHEVVDNDYEGVCAVLRWLAFVPRARGAPLPLMEVGPGDAADRDVDFEPPPGGAAYDPRLMLTGHAVAAAAPGAGGSSSSSSGGVGTWVSGFCDKGSWVETMAGWAKSVVTGRARLGGIPIGIIVPELRTSTAVVPADPASPDSKEAVLTQAGQVWFPDSAFKTAQALRDFAGEEEGGMGPPLLLLPLPLHSPSLVRCPCCCCRRGAARRRLRELAGLLRRPARHGRRHSQVRLLHRRRARRVRGARPRLHPARRRAARRRMGRARPVHQLGRHGDVRRPARPRRRARACGHGRGQVPRA